MIVDDNRVRQTRRQGDSIAGPHFGTIVPGVTAASAAAAQFGFPLTHRGEARRLVLATVRTRDGEVVEDGWPGLADPSATLALYMGRECAAATLLIAK